MAILTVDKNGKAPAGAKVGDVIVTGGGSYQITGGTPGSWTSDLIDKNTTTSNYVPNTATNNASSPGKSSTGGGSSGSKPSTDTPKSGSITGTGESESDTGYLDSSIQDALKELRDVQKANRVAALDKALNTATAGLDTEQSNLKTTFQGQRNQAAADADVGQLNFAQYMASRGVKGSAGGLPAIYRNVGLQNRLGQIGQQEAAANADVESRRSALQSNYASDVAAAEAGTESDYLTNYINQANLDREYLANQTAAEKQEYANNIGAYSNDYQAEIDRLKALGAPDDDYRIIALNKARNEKIEANKAAQAAAEEKAAANKTAQEQANFENALSTFKTTGIVNAQWIADALGLTMGSRAADFDIARLQAANEAARISQQGQQDALNAKEKADSKLDSDLQDMQQMGADGQELYNYLIASTSDPGLAATLIMKYGLQEYVK